jgi:DNA uptake protein ComE-like DNA-binding protein
VAKRPPARVAAKPAPKPAPAPAPKVDLNTAPAAEIEKLPLIDLATAQAIEKGRPYAFTQELVTKKILSAAVFKVIEPYVVVK